MNRMIRSASTFAACVCGDSLPAGNWERGGGIESPMTTWPALSAQLTPLVGHEGPVEACSGIKARSLQRALASDTGRDQVPLRLERRWIGRQQAGSHALEHGSRGRRTHGPLTFRDASQPGGSGGVVYAAPG